jgi:hypothetical protein
VDLRAFPDDGREAGQRDLLGPVILVQEEVLALLVGDVNGLAVLTPTEVHDESDVAGTAGRLASIGQLDLAGVDVGIERLITAKTILGFFQAIVLQVSKKTHVGFLSLSGFVVGSVVDGLGRSSALVELVQVIQKNLTIVVHKRLALVEKPHR